MQAKECVIQGALWVGEERSIPKNRKNGSYKASSLFLASHTFGCVGIRCQWYMKPIVLALSPLSVASGRTGRVHREPLVLGRKPWPLPVP